MAYIIKEQPESTRTPSSETPLSEDGDGIVFRGAVRKLWGCKDLEVMVSGPAETGKTFGCLAKLNAMAWKYPNGRFAICRRTYQSMKSTVLQTFQEQILGETFPNVVTAYGGEKIQWYNYPNGSCVYVVGLDNADKLLSGEFDAIYVNQAEECMLEDWEKMISRTTGRANHMPYSQIYGDCNPGPSTHWIKQRFGDRLMVSRHEDNPTLFTADGQITERGERTMFALESLTGIRKQRLRYGLWVSSEGQIYQDYDSIIHTTTRAKVPKCYRFIETVDFGFTHPFVWGRWAISPDGDLYLTHQIYHTQRLVEEHCKLIKSLRLSDPEAIPADHDAEDRATFERYRGCRTIPAMKLVRPGIEAVQLRLRLQRNGRPRIFFCSDSLIQLDRDLKDRFQPTRTEEEFESYVWNELKDAPVKERDDGMDMTRYAVAYVDKPRVSGRKNRSFSYVH